MILASCFFYFKKSSIKTFINDHASSHSSIKSLLLTENVGLETRLSVTGAMGNCLKFQSIGFLKY